MSPRLPHTILSSTSLVCALAAPAIARAQDPAPDLSLSASKLGGEMVVTLVNPRHDQAMDVDCTLRGVSAKPGRAEILHDSSINAYNSFEQPDRLMVKPHEVAVESGRLRVTLPAMSIVTVRLGIS